ncbi:MAG: hypothetical protein ACI8TX_001080 [Hyphomicrobiaceae bacterium]
MNAAKAFFCSRARRPRLLRLGVVRLGLVQLGLLQLGIVVASLVLAASASAHLGELSYSELRVRDELVLYRLKLAAHLIPGAGEAPSAEKIDGLRESTNEWIADNLEVYSGGTACTPVVDSTVGPDRDDDLKLLVIFTCEDPVQDLRVRFQLFSGRVEGWRNIVSVRHGQRSWSHIFETAAELLVLEFEPQKAAIDNADDPATEQVSFTSSFAAFFRLGMTHIWEGYDHLLFLGALLVGGGTIAELAGIVTAFTIAHSITLIAATLGLVSLPSGPVELTIAVSIMFVAAENFRAAKPRSRTAVTFAFGLIHGFGFAGVLGEAGLEAGSLFAPLLAFNLGVEVGQFAVVLVVVPVLAAVLGGSRERTGRLVLSALIFAAGAFWALERLPSIW